MPVAPESPVNFGAQGRNERNTKRKLMNHSQDKQGLISKNITLPARRVPPFVTNSLMYCLVLWKFLDLHSFILLYKEINVSGAFC
uniref:Uncharacterized protein n=1 Tax=Pararge aegeria TaxID=116150 RepID=S4NQW6_9NEOP